MSARVIMAMVGLRLGRVLRDPAAEWGDIALTTLTKGSHAVRSERWRYIRYANGDEELYDHKTDSNEWKNLAALPEYDAVKKKLARHLPEKEGKKK